MPHPTQAFDNGVAVTGMSTRVPQHVVYQAALTLRQLLDSGVHPEDPRCRALLQLVNTARLIILPTSNNGAKIATDLASRAAHIDVSTATVAAIMGLNNVASLTGAASAEITAAPANSQPPRQTPPLTIKLLPKPAQRATDALVNLVKNDSDLGNRARNDAEQKSTTMANKMHKLRNAQRLASVRRRRFLSEHSPLVPQPSTPATYLPSRPRPPVAPIPIPAPLSQPTSPPPENHLQKFILPRENMVYSSNVQLPIEHIPPSPTAQPSPTRQDPTHPTPAPNLTSPQATQPPHPNLQQFSHSAPHPHLQAASYPPNQSLTTRHPQFVSHSSPQVLPHPLPNHPRQQHPPQLLHHSMPQPLAHPVTPPPPPPQNHMAQLMLPPRHYHQQGVSHVPPRAYHHRNVQTHGQPNVQPRVQPNLQPHIQPHVQNQLKPHVQPNAGERPTHHILQRVQPHVQPHVQHQVHAPIRTSVQLLPQQQPLQPQAHRASFPNYRSLQNMGTAALRNPAEPSSAVQGSGHVGDNATARGETPEGLVSSSTEGYQLHQEAMDNSSRIRAVLKERERILSQMLRRRQVELAAMPLGMTEQTRRKAIIEAKQLSLIELQRVVRSRVCAEMKKMFSLAVQEDGTVPADHLSRWYRRRDPPIYSYTDGYPRITPFDGVPEMAPRPPPVVAEDSLRMAQFDMSRMGTQKKQRKRDFNAKLILHFENFQAAVGHARNCQARIARGFERYFLERKRIEEKKKKMERIERLRLLRSNDETAYLNLLKDTKNERLLQLVRQTDSYLMRIGAQVEKSREHLSGGEGGAGPNAFAEELAETEQTIDTLRRRKDLYYTVTHAIQEEVRQPSIMVHGTLKPYQIEGLKWMVSLYNNNLNGILADEMGLGKTIQTISLITYLVEKKKNPGPYLIIVPLSTMGNWVRELDLWAPSLVKVCYRGDRYTRRAIQQRQMSRNDYNVLLTTYEFTVKDQNVLSRVPWQYIIIDEGHRMKNANCKLAMTLGVKYKSRNRLLLTGTPLQNNLTELWALLNFLLPTIFSSAETFETWFKKPFESTTLGDTAELEEEETLLVINRLHQVLRPFLLRRLKTDVESQLPQKVEHVIRCDMSAWQRVLYRQVQSRIGLATGEHNGSVKSYNNLLMQSKKICNHPYLFYDQEAILDLPADYLIRASGKFSLLQHMLPKLRMHGHRTLIFSQMTAALDYLEDFLSGIGIQYMRLDGSTRADDRQELLNRFNAEDSPYFCFLLSTRAGGLGLNLQTADTVIIFDSDWNPMMDLQAQDRAHRIGQTKIVRVYRLICSGTVEVKILERANQKLQVDAQVIQAGQFNNKSTDTDRTQMLKDLLRQKNEEGDELGAVPDKDELNRLFARTEEEFDSFCKYDQETRENKMFRPLFESESELPAWVLQPDVQHKTAEEKEQEILQSHGRGRRRRKSNPGLDLTDHEWMKVMEGELTMDEVIERRKRRTLRLSARNEAIARGSTTESATPSIQNEDSSEREVAASTARARVASKLRVEDTPTSPPLNANSDGVEPAAKIEIGNGELISSDNDNELENSTGRCKTLSTEKSTESQTDREASAKSGVEERHPTGIPETASSGQPDHRSELAEVHEVKNRTADSQPAHGNAGKPSPVFLKLRLHPSGEVKHPLRNGAVRKRHRPEVNDIDLKSQEQSKKQKRATPQPPPSARVVLPEESVQPIPQTGEDEKRKDAGQHSSLADRPRSRKRKRQTILSRPSKSGQVNGVVRKSRRKRMKVDENRAARETADVSTKESSADDSRPNLDTEPEYNLHNLEESELDEAKPEEPRESVILKLRIRKESQRRRRSTHRVSSKS